MNHNVSVKRRKQMTSRARNEAGIREENNLSGRPAGIRLRIKCGNGESGPRMMRPGFPSASVCPNSSSYYPNQSAKRRFLSTALFSEAQPSFSQQIPKVICERSCRMAKTLTVKITLKEEKESGKTKKNRKKTVFLDDLYEKTLKKHTKSSGSSLFRRVTRWLRRMNKTGRKRRPIRLRCPA